MPNARCRKGFIRLQVQIENRRMGVLATGVGEMYADMSFEGRFIRREPGVAIYAEERTPRRSRVGDKMRAELVQMRREVADKHQCRVTNHLFISLLVFGEPFP